MYPCLPSAHQAYLDYINTSAVAAARYFAGKRQAWAKYQLSDKSRASWDIYCADIGDLVNSYEDQIRLPLTRWKRASRREMLQ